MYKWDKPHTCIKQIMSTMVQKIVIIGDSGVGKSCLLVRFAENEYKDTYLSTMGLEFRFRVIKIGDTNVKVQLWDTAGQERFKSLTRSYYRGADGIMLVFDVTDKKSFSNVSSWLEEANSSIGISVPILLVGTKIDLVDERVISKEEIQKFAEQLNLSYIETSAKDNINVSEGINKLVHDIYEIKSDAIKKKSQDMSERSYGPPNWVPTCCT